MKEFDFIHTIQNLSVDGGVELGIGDDTALIHGTLAAKDIMAEGVHFLPSTPLDKVAFKLFTANVSDIAAMGGTPTGTLLGVSSSGGFDQQAFLRGVKQAVQEYRVPLIGGDTTGSSGGLFLSLTVLGKPGEHLLTRGGAVPGDVIFLSRPTGLARISLEVELKTHTHAFHPYYHLAIRAETALGKLLGGCADVTACIDISDGIGRDASHIAEKSCVQMRFDATQVPVDHLAPFGVDSLGYALGSGEEYALLFTVSPDAADDLAEKVFTTLGRHIYPIGTVAEGSGCILVHAGGREEDIASKGFEHRI